MCVVGTRGTFFEKIEFDPTPYIYIFLFIGFLSWVQNIPERMNQISTALLYYWTKITELHIQRCQLFVLKIREISKN